MVLGRPQPPALAGGYVAQGVNNYILVITSYRPLHRNQHSQQDKQTGKSFTREREDETLRREHIMCVYSIFVFPNHC